MFRYLSYPKYKSYSAFKIKPRVSLSFIRSETSVVIQRRINYIIEYLTYDIFKYKSRGLYEIHKYMFILLMTLKIDLQRGSIMHEEFQYLIKGGAALDLKAVEPKPCKWITDVTWLNLVALSSLRQFQYIVSQVPTSEKLWKHWFDKEAPEEEIIPDGYNTLDAFRRLLLIRYSFGIFLWQKNYYKEEKIRIIKYFQKLKYLRIKVFKCFQKID